jgi:hypothetical protein
MAYTELQLSSAGSLAQRITCCQTTCAVLMAVGIQQHECSLTEATRLYKQVGQIVSIVDNHHGAQFQSALFRACCALMTSLM